MFCSFGIVFLLLEYLVVNSFHQWSYQSTLKIDEGLGFGETSGVVNGRGFQYLASASYSNSSVYIFATDNGSYVAGKNLWSQVARLQPSNPSEQAETQFGHIVKYFNNTILVSAPYFSIRTQRNIGSVYFFNGTRRHWSQLQRLQGADTYSNDKIGMSMDVSEDGTVVMGAPGQTTSTGAAYVFTQNSVTGLWSQQAKLLSSMSTINQQFGERVSTSDGYIAIAARNDFIAGLNF